MRMFMSFHEVGVTVLIATHDLGLVARFPGRVVGLDQGRVAT
jgi:cell division transport system ATP-binding protein